MPQRSHLGTWSRPSSAPWGGRGRPRPRSPRSVTVGGVGQRGKGQAWSSSCRLSVNLHCLGLVPSCAPGDSPADLTRQMKPGHVCAVGTPERAVPVAKENSGSWGFGSAQDSMSPLQTLRVQPSSQNCVTEATAVLGVSQDWGPVPLIPAPHSHGQAAERGRTGRQFPCCQKEFFHWLAGTRS